MTEDSIVVSVCDLGLGIFARRPFKAAEYLLRFAGPIIDLETALAKGDKKGNPLQIGDNHYLDLLPPGVYVNHSCDPNAGMRNSVELHALRNIEVGEEIRMDYSTTMLEGGCWTMDCRCGSKKCRHVIRDFDQLPSSLRETYLAQGIVQPFIAAQYQKEPNHTSEFTSLTRRNSR